VRSGLSSQFVLVAAAVIVVVVVVVHTVRFNFNASNLE